MQKKLLLALTGLLLLLLGACGQSAPSLNTTVAPVTTLCPDSGTVRAAIVPPLRAGRNDNLVYYDQGNTAGDSAVQLKRLDIVQHTITPITSFINGGIVDARMSADGDWILFTLGISYPHFHLELRLIRVDGKYQQTLYCWPQLVDTSSWENGEIVWSPDGTAVALTTLIDTTQLPAITLLDLAQGGQAQQELTTTLGPWAKTSSGESYRQWTESYRPVSWLDNTHLALAGSKVLRSTGGISRETIYLLDTSKGANQSVSDLQTVSVSNFPQTAGSRLCDFTSAPGSSQFYIATCTYQNTTGTYLGPSSITAQPADVSKAKTIYQTPAMTINRITGADAHSLLFLSQSPSGNGVSNDSLWRINTDGSGLLNLVHSANVSWCGIRQDTCQTVSHDDEWYALVGFNPDSSVSLFYGSLTGGQLTTATQLSPLAGAFVGWTEI